MFRCVAVGLRFWRMQAFISWQIVGHPLNAVVVQGHTTARLCSLVSFATRYAGVLAEEAHSGPE